MKMIGLDPHNCAQMPTGKMNKREDHVFQGYTMSINCGWVMFLVVSMYGDRNGSEGWQLRKKPTEARRITVNDICELNVFVCCC